ncbi:MAG: hypothetical protein J6P87_02005 [Lachnospiraceae bacterium]|nr:hypothetical protein [Lachnospiraceae bacterium]
MENEKRDLFDEPVLKEENVYLYDDEDDESFHTTDIDLDDSFFTAPLPPIDHPMTEEPAEPEEAAAPAPSPEPAMEEAAAEELPAEEPEAPVETAVPEEEDFFEPDFDSALEQAFEPGFGSFGEEPFEPGFEPDFEVSDESYDFYTAGEETPRNVRPERRSAEKRARAAAPVEEEQYYYEPEYDDEEPAPRRRKGSFLPFLIVALLVLLAAAAVASVIYVRRNNSKKEEAALEELARSAVEDVSNGRYDEALQKADKLYYTSGYSNKIRLKWDDERATLIDYIETERRRGDSPASEEEAPVQAPAAEEAAEPEEPGMLSLDECIEMAKSELPFGNFDVIIQDKILYISFWQAGYGDQAMTAKQNRGEALAAWNSMQDDIRSANNRMRIVLNENGHENYDLIYALLNDIDTEYTLYEVMNGIVTYAAVR